MLIPDGAPGRTFLEQLGRNIEMPMAILCVSAHWETRNPMVSTATAPETIYDSYVFPTNSIASHTPRLVPQIWRGRRPNC